MWRDMELIRTIAMHVREHGKQPSEVEGYTAAVLHYHCWLLFEAKLADGADATLGSELNARLYALTWAGHNFADAATSESVWREATGAIARAATPVSFETLLHILAENAIEHVRAARKR